MESPPGVTELTTPKALTLWSLLCIPLQDLA